MWDGDDNVENNDKPGPGVGTNIHRPFTMDDINRMVGSMQIEMEALRRENMELRALLAQTYKAEPVKREL